MLSVLKLVWKPLLLLGLKVAGVYVKKSSSKTDDEIFQHASETVKDFTRSPRNRKRGGRNV